MIVALVLATTVAQEAPARFWGRDLGGLVRLLEMHRKDSDPSHQFFAELVQLLNCEPLPPLDSNASPERIALRLEEARRNRLGADAATSDTLWRDAMQPEFFNRDSSHDEPTDPQLRWNNDGEHWPDETIHLPPLVSRCPTTTSTGDELQLLSSEAFAKPGTTELASRWAYQRTVLLLRAGRIDEARQVAAAIQPDALAESLRPYARFMIALSGTDPRPFEALASAAIPDDIRFASLIQLSSRASAGHQWDRVATITAPVEEISGHGLSPAELTAVRYLLALRAQALRELNRSPELGRLVTTGFPYASDQKEPTSAMVRELAFDWLVQQPFDAAKFTSWVQTLGPENLRNSYWRTLGDRALQRERWSVAEGAIAQLQSMKELAPRAHALELRGRLALARRQHRAFETTLDTLLSSDTVKDLPRRQLSARDESALALLHTVLLDQAALADARWTAVIEKAFDRARLTISAPYRSQLNRLEQRFLSRRQGNLDWAIPQVAVGTLHIPSKSIPLDPPTIEIAWPEPRSLLSIPVPNGPSRDWFFSEEAHIDVPEGHGGARP